MNPLILVAVGLLGSEPHPAVPPPPKYVLDEHGMLVPVAEPRPGERLPERPRPVFDPPESGLEVTPGHRVVGCVQIPIEAPPEGAYTVNLWPGGVIPYVFDSNVSVPNRRLVRDAMDEVQGMCNVNFREADLFDPAWIHIQASTENSAPVGYLPGRRIVKLVNFEVRYIIVHELFHVLGIWHEQSRADRNDFVTINWSNVSQTACGGPCNHNFGIDEPQTIIGQYNFGSIMHYPRDAFSIGGDTITVRPPWDAIWQNRIGNREALTFGDRHTTMHMYPPSWLKVADRGASFNGIGTWSAPFNNFPNAYNAAPSGGDVVLFAGHYPAIGSWTRRMRLHAPNGNVRLGQ